ncbi:hypothetical protein FOIG_06055 [Fusarium odoratissimum NRRL 54006]|uniref:Uncharacterized protein n=1 Tax=Fusarium odoratissimum (strain NRRL 54006) TaxID=1089451 RepID=X0K372_FUSO5|nr:uncharacterized protein FOIG_06055 [Fusarium odoratissimum NRRL 54006]EXM03177.1 hypothetical protein FOIG_06055 [Fusarium odoratissimum NRRL 54006]
MVSQITSGSVNPWTLMHVDDPGLLTAQPDLSNAARSDSSLGPLPQVTGQASSRPDELSFVILGTSSVEAAEIASLLEAELRQAHHRYKHCTVASPATCLAALKANSATHVFVIFDDVVGDVEDTVSDELCDEKTLGIAANVLALLRDELNLKMSLTILQDLDLKDA